MSVPRFRAIGKGIMLGAIGGCVEELGVGCEVIRDLG